MKPGSRETIVKNTLRWTLGCLLTGLITVGALTLPARAQDFLCSGGPKDGQACPAGDDDCFVSCPSSFGACVLVQGVCNGGDFDSFPCDCPGGTCSAAGTCTGGAFNGEACTNTDGGGTCGTGIACVGSYKVCISGSDKGFGCLSDDQCTASSCRATGKFCDGGDFADFTCFNDADCTNTGGASGVCRAPVVDCPTSATPTRTPTVIGATRTPTATSRTIVPTATRTPTRTGSQPPSTTPTRTRTAAPGLTATATRSKTPDSTGNLTALVSQNALAGSHTLVVDDNTRFPDRGTISIDSSIEQLLYTRVADGHTLTLDKALVQTVGAGAVVTVRAPFSPTPYIIHKTVYQQGGSCALQPVGSTDGAGSLGLLIGAAVMGLLRRRR